MAAVEIARVVKNYGAVPVLKGIDLVVPEGGFVVLVGPSGCGKSTLLRMIAGLESVTSGDIRIGDRRVNDLPPRERDVAMVFQDYALYPHKTVAENIGFGLRMRGADRTTVERKVREAAQILRIEHLLDRKPGQLSGGQRQRVAMGRAIVREPKVFLFDEPLSNLDAQLRGEMRIEIKKLYQRFGVTTVYVTHDQVEAMTLAEKIAIMRAGELEQYATPDEIYNRPASVFVGGFIGAPRMNFLSATVSADGGSVTLDGLAPIPVPEGAPLRAAAGRKVTLGLRPEHVALGGPLAADVVLVEPLGSDLNALLQIGGQEAAGRFAPDSKLQPGQGVTLSLRLERARVFDPQSGLAI